MNPITLRLIQEALSAGVPPLEIAMSLGDTDYQIAYMLGFIDCISGAVYERKPHLRLIAGGKRDPGRA